MKGYQEKLFHHEGGQTLPHVFQKGYGKSVIGGTWALIEQGPIAKAEAYNSYKL